MTDGTFSTRVENVLLELASQEATGALTVSEPDGEHSTVWFRDGLVYSVSVPGRRPLLGVRLMSSGALTPESLAEALEVQRTELQGWRLGELLVHLGFVNRNVVEAFVLEQVHDQVADLLHWQVAAHRFRNGQRTRQDVAPPAEVTVLLAEARARDERWTTILADIGGADTVPVLSTSDDAASDVVLGPHDWALLCKVDGVRSIADLADDCGFTVFEAGLVVEGLITAGLVDVEFAEADAGVRAEAPWVEDHPSDADVATSVARVTAALTDMLSPAGGRPFAAPAPAVAPSRSGSPFGAPPILHTEAEPELADVVSLQQERDDRKADKARVQAEQTAQRIADETRLEAERLAAEEEAERLEDIRLDAEAREAAEREEAERVAAEEEEEEEERLEEARLDAEAREIAEREEAERVAVEEEEERLAAARATEAAHQHAAQDKAQRREAARIEREERARREARAATDRKKAEKAARRLAEHSEADRLASLAQAELAQAERLEEERLETEAREDAEREEAERVAAEEAAAERLAAEEAAAAALLEAERIAAEAAEVEAARIAAMDAAEAAAARLEAARITAEQAAA
ncbi:MAG: DUF4388 domain-containing protein, partial [Candidatus Nanopelagicales bacterium]